MFLAGDQDCYLVEMPFIACRSLTPADFGGVRAAELQPPAADGFVAHHDAEFGQHLLDHPQAQREAEVEPDGVGNNRRWIAVASIQSGAIHLHLQTLFRSRTFGQSAS